MIGTGFLVAFILAVIDEYNAPVKANMAPLIIGFIVVAVGLSFGANAGYAINPARDFGPRMFAFLEGWKQIAFPGDYGNVNTYFWIPIVGPLVGGVVGALVYDFGIRKRADRARRQARPRDRRAGRGITPNRSHPPRSR